MFRHPHIYHCFYERPQRDISGGGETINTIKILDLVGWVRSTYRSMPAVVIVD